jgi:hypothetical protein
LIENSAKIVAENISEFAESTALYDHEKADIERTCKILKRIYCNDMNDK